MTRHAAALLCLLAILTLGGCPCPPRMGAPPQHVLMQAPPGERVAYTIAP